MLGVKNGNLIKAAPFTNFDIELTIKSFKKLTKYDIETVICYHGGVYKKNVNKRIAELSKE